MSRMRLNRRRPLRDVAAVAIAVLVFGALAGCGDDSSGPEFLEPKLTAASPDSGNVGTRVEITGADFQAGAGVRFGPFPALAVELESSSVLYAYAADSVKVGNVYDITVTNPGGKSATLSAAYRGVPPELRVVNGVSRPSGNNGSPVTFEGRSFGDYLGTGTVYFTDGAGQPVPADVELPENWTNEFIMATVPAGAESGPVWIDTPTGATERIFFSVTQSATFSPSLIHWTPTTVLPDSLQGAGTAFLPVVGPTRSANVICVTGGANGALVPRSSVWIAEASGSGELSPWAASTDLPAPRAFHGAVVATPYNALIDTMVVGHLYVAGGIDGSGAPTTSVARATIGIDGTLGGWTEVMPLPVPLHSMGITIYRSWIFVAGGATYDNEPVAAVYRARIGFDGELGPWESQTSLPAPRSYVPLLQFAGGLYVVGGESAAVAPGAAEVSGTQLSTIVTHRLDRRTAAVGTEPWALNPSQLIKQVSKHSALIAGATMLVSGGIYNGAENSATEHQYAEMNPDYTVGSFHGATGSQTIGGSTGAGGVPFFNHSAITYVDGTGAAHVIILGGASVGDPAVALRDTYYY